MSISINMVNVKSVLGAVTKLASVVRSIHYDLPISWVSTFLVCDIAIIAQCIFSISFPATGWTQTQCLALAVSACGILRRFLSTGLTSSIVRCGRLFSANGANALFAPLFFSFAVPFTFFALTGATDLLFSFWMFDAAIQTKSFFFELPLVFLCLFVVFFRATVAHSTRCVVSFLATSHTQSLVLPFEIKAICHSVSIVT